MSDKPQYKLKHVGINAADEAEARATTELLCHLFNVEINREVPNVSFFTDPLFEIMKYTDHATRGVHGHVGLQTNDVEAAMADLASKGITFQENTITRNEEGKITFVYLEQQVAGFSFHISL